MALSKVDYNSLNVTAAASKALLWNSAADGFETGDIAGALVLLETQTASSDSTISFTSGIDSTYKEYIFKFYDIHASETAFFQFNLSIDSGSNYNVTKTTTLFQAYADEADTSTALQYNTGQDLAQGTGFQYLNEMTASNDDSGAGSLHLFDPSSTTFVKHFIAVNNGVYSAYTNTRFVAGYGNTTSAVDAVQFAMSAGNIDAGTIKMYGVS